MSELAQQLTPIARLNKDLKEATHTLSKQEVRYLVDSYYMMQENRKRADNQIRALNETGEPHEVIEWLAKNNRDLENQIKVALDVYSGNHPVGQWARSVHGIGPVIAAGLIAHIDITKAPTAGHIWSFAGQDPTKEWGKGERRPWNANLKTLCWKIGESFVKVSNKEGAFYGQLYKDRKELEIERNEKLMFKDQAEAKLKKYNIGKTTDAYKHYSVGKLPPAHIQARAKRYAVKLFLAHFHEVMYKDHYKIMPPNPYPIAILGHAHKIEVPYQSEG